MRGRLAQLVRASALHAEGRGFESLSVHTTGVTMLQYKNVLAEDTISEIMAERSDRKHIHMWAAGNLFWNSHLLAGVTSTCLASLVSEQIRIRVENELRDILPPFNKLAIQHYVWLRGAGIAQHTDNVYDFSATIYLNKTWNVNQGGLFLWKEKETIDYTAIVPEYNSMLLNTSAYEHLVTPVAYDSPEVRHTLQITNVKN